MRLPIKIFSALKRIKLSIQIILVFLITVKLALAFVFLYQVGIDTLFTSTNAIASETRIDSQQGEKAPAAAGKEGQIDLNFLIQKKAALDQKEKRLAQKQAELVAIQQDINHKIEKLTQLRNEIRSELASQKAAEDQKLKHLIKVYSAMKPQNAAGLIEKLDKQLAIKLLSKMKGEDVGKILSYVDIEKAATISEGLVKKE